MAADLLEKHMRSTSHQWMHERSEIFICSIYAFRLFLVTVHRVLEFVERRSDVHQQFERGFGNDQWFDGPRNYACEQYNEGFHPSSDQQYFDNPNFHRNSPPLRHDAPFNQRYNRQDLRTPTKLKEEQSRSPFPQERSGVRPSSKPAAGQEKKFSSCAA
ncbi:hypothetical protein fugu_011589 [Takifugu bimaculatus]|uniref:Uncharacterized protein n=1 Tax=Takifugu bimaculatus TaxID=433685 RepID=A0A4Z2C7Z5_9TELE|nr:hypothetical protein fugu_011589 [Takifugu bimaculatus]